MHIGYWTLGHFYLNWVLGPFLHGRLQNLQSSEVTFAHVITPLRLFCHCRRGIFHAACTKFQVQVHKDLTIAFLF